MNVRKRVFFTWDECLVAFNTFSEATEYLQKKFDVVLLDVPGGWHGVDPTGVGHWLWTTIIHYNDGKMVHD